MNKRIKDALISEVDVDGIHGEWIDIEGTHEIHYDDTVNFHKKGTGIWGESELHEYENMVHAFPILAPMFHEATKALMDICSFINDKLS
jgi:acetyl esterase/lipase